MALIEKSGGIEGFIHYMLHQKGWIKSQRGSLFLTYMIGVFIFVESSITSLIAGAVGRPLCDKYKIPHAKLAYICDVTAAPVSSLIIVNGWGALLLGIIGTQITQHSLGFNNIDLLIDSILYNFYAMSALVVAFVSLWFSWDFSVMKHAKFEETSVLSQERKGNSALLMVLPLLLMVGLVFVFLAITGNGNIYDGSGSSSLFYTMLTTLAFMFVYYILKTDMSVKTWGKTSYDGARKLLPITFILLFAFAIGDITSQLHTGEYLASLVNENVPLYLLGTLIFLISSVIAFATGTSWGTFSIMVPVAVPMALALDANVALCIGAAISGGVFGDHASPLSDTTIISAMASDCEVIEHVTTQLPYALLSALITACLFVAFSLVS
jgi:Na+/H+ antiporter NhaC